MSAPEGLRVCLVTDAFPPRCGGSGWSAFALARALRDGGHAVWVVKPQARLRGSREREIDAIPVTDFGYWFRDAPFVRGWLREERLRRRLADFLVAEARRRGADLFHAQHWLSAAPAVEAAAQLGIPSVVTVRDYWPICYFTTWHVGGERCPDCSLPKMVACVRERAPVAPWVAAPLFPAMRRRVRRRQAWLARADGIVAVSRFVAEEVVRPIADGARTVVIGNAVDPREVEAALARPAETPLPESFVFFAGKLHRNKGAQFVLDVMERLPARLPLVVAGEGPERASMEARASARGLDVRFLPWLEPQEVWRIQRAATVFVAPAVWAEPLSRTVIEAMTAGAAIVATDGGGIRDQIDDGVSGLIRPADTARFAEAVVLLLNDAALRRRLGEGAERAARERFHPSVVGPAHEALYRRLLERHA